ncbi:MAG: ATP-binding cassette domain-containing protein [Eubacterium sp.]|nr:ATP-binding cassette domain-containing protein [Eubacterium sp.]
MAYIEAKGYRYTYEGGERPALVVDSLSIEKGELVLVIGPSGGGKTTLLRRIAEETGLRGESVGTMEVNADRFGYVWQDPSAQLVCHRVEAEIVFGMENHGFSVADMERRLAEVVTFFGIEHLVHREVNGLSAGEKQTVNIAGAVAGIPELLLLDEPTSSLDPMSAEQLAGLVRKIHRELGMTVIVSEQRPELFFEMADRILVLQEGHLIFDGGYRSMPESVTGAEYLQASVRIALQNGASPEDVMDTVSRRTWWKNHEDIICGEADDAHPTHETREKGSHKFADNGKDTRIQLKKVCFSYHREDPDVLRECSFDVGDGITALVGGNGSGKTTLAEVIAGYNRPYRGKVIGRPDRIAYLPAEPELLFVDEPFDGSGGEKEWHGIELVLLKEAELYILDEPTKGLDPERKKNLAGRLRGLADAGKQVLLVTHDIEFAAGVADTMAMMYDGRIVACEDKKSFLKGNMFYTTELQRLLSWG